MFGFNHVSVIRTACCFSWYRSLCSSGNLLQMLLALKVDIFRNFCCITVLAKICLICLLFLFVRSFRWCFTLVRLSARPRCSLQIKLPTSTMLVAVQIEADQKYENTRIHAPTRRGLHTKGYLRLAWLRMYWTDLHQMFNIGIDLCWWRRSFWHSFCNCYGNRLSGCGRAGSRLLLPRIFWLWMWSNVGYVRS